MLLHLADLLQLPRLGRQGKDTASGELSTVSLSGDQVTQHATGIAWRRRLLKTLDDVTQCIPSSRVHCQMWIHEVMIIRSEAYGRGQVAGTGREEL